jgi:hypothetical protein
MKVNACFMKEVDGRNTCIIVRSIELPHLLNDNTSIKKIVMRKKPPGLHWKLTSWVLAEEKK